MTTLTEIPDFGTSTDLTFHGKTVEQAQWVLDYFGTPEKREAYKYNISYKKWMEDCQKVVDEGSSDK